MPVFQVYVASCGTCGMYAPRPSSQQPAVEDRHDAFTSASEQNVITNAIRKGWSAYPILCPICNRRVKEDADTGRWAVERPHEVEVEVEG